MTMDGPPREPAPDEPTRRDGDGGEGSADRPGPEESVELGTTRVVDGPEAEQDTAVRSSRPTEQAAPAGRGTTISSRVGDFRLIRKLGKGAMATVYKARQVSQNRKVALKILFKHVAETPKLLERFYREARVLGRLDHPNLVQGYCVGEHQGLHYFAMEYVSGASLQSWLDRLGRLSVGDALHVTLACARALDYAHGLDVIHRDVKPDNVLITSAGVVKVADLGMVKMLDEDLSLTQTGHAVGTPWYMPLEQARNAKETDGRCDIYALGCMFYHMLVGKPPFQGPTLVDLIREKQQGTFPPARQYSAEVPERLDLILAKMTAKLPRHRYQSCAEVIKDLESLELASPALTFLSAPQAPPEEKPDTATELPVSSAPTPAPATRPPADEWQVRYKKADGQVAQRQLSTAEVLRLIEAGQLGPTARASRGKDSFRALATYREFEQAVLGQAARSGADRQTARYRSLYKKIAEEDRRRGEGKEDEAARRDNYHYWVGLALKFGLPLAGLAGIIFFLRWVVQAIQ
jgi:serine/threonine-protein kinase